MKSKPYDILVFIGRFSPFHKGHEFIVNTALNLSEEVYILVGSSMESRSIKNPWTFHERCEMIESVFPENINKRITVLPILDYPYNDNKWKASVRSVVNSKSRSWSNFPPKIGLIGHNKDSSSYYLKMFPDWNGVSVENYHDINATWIRGHMFSKTEGDFSNCLNSNVEKICLDNLKLYDEWQMIEKYKESWKNSPYNPIFQTVDAVVIQSGHVLMIKRKSSPGKGQWALPGGFLNQDEKLLDGAIRELKEETKIDVPARLLKRLATGTEKTFDHPFRSTRGRTITTAFLIDLGDDKKLPKIKASDDAESVEWIPFSSLRRDKIYEDHFHIIDHYTGIA